MWYQRDASWFDRPDTRRAKKYHLFANGRPVCGTQVVKNEQTEDENPPQRLRCVRCDKTTKKG